MAIIVALYGITAENNTLPDDRLDDTFRSKQHIFSGLKKCLENLGRTYFLARKPQYLLFRLLAHKYLFQPMHMELKTKE